LLKIKSSLIKHRPSAPFRFFLDELLFEKFRVRQIAGGLLIQKRMQKNLKSMTGGGRLWRMGFTIEDIDGGTQDMKSRNEENQS
jgi:hypothetical protein